MNRDSFLNFVVKLLSTVLQACEDLQVATLLNKIIWRRGVTRGESYVFLLSVLYVPVSDKDLVLCYVLRVL